MYNDNSNNVKEYDIADIWDSILEYEIATESELQLVTNINGYNKETLNDVIEVRSGYKSLEQYIEYEL